MDLKILHERLAENEDYRRSYAEENLIHRVAERVREIRDVLGLSQSQLADKLGTQQPAIARIEGGYENLTLRRLSNIAFELDCRPEDFVKRDVPLVLTGGWPRDTDGQGTDDLDGEEKHWSKSTTVHADTAKTIDVQESNDLAAAGV